MSEDYVTRLARAIQHVETPVGAILPPIQPFHDRAAEYLAALSGVPEGAASDPVWHQHVGWHHHNDPEHPQPDHRHIPVPSPEPLDVERLVETATDFVDAVIAYLDPENQFTESRLRTVNNTMGDLAAALDRLAAPQPVPEDET